MPRKGEEDEASGASGGAIALPGENLPSMAPASIASSSKPRPQASVPKRKGPPTFQFLTATDLSHFKNADAKRSVRSQAMIQYRYKQKRKTNKAQVEAAPEKCERITPILLNEHAVQSSQDALSQWVGEPQEPVYRTTSEAWWAANENATVHTTPDWPVQTALCRPTSNASLRKKDDHRVNSYEDTDAHDTELLRIIIATVRSSQRMGNGMDPFTTLPQFRDPNLDAIFLVRKCNRTFSSKSTLQRWLPVMLSDPHILLSSTLMATTWLDMHAGICGESKRTVRLKQEAIGYINERLRDGRALEDSTLAVIIHVLAGEMWNSNENTLRIHQKGVARLIAHRGGMDNLGGYGVMAQAAAAATYHGDLICEATPLPLFYQWEAPPYLVDDTTAVPESPVYCPREEFVTIVHSQYCSGTTLGLLCDMRELTDICIAHSAALGTVFDLDIQSHDAWHAPSLATYDTKLAGIRARLVSLPSAHVPNLCTTHDWVYEACRIAAIIYTSALIMRVPLSVAAYPAGNVIMRDIASLMGATDSEQASIPRLTETLYETIEKTNIGDLWGSMTGVFYWVTTVGAAAARTPVNIDVYSRPSCVNEAYATWVRRCLIMFATRAMILMVFEHPLPLILAEKKLLKVQELLGSGSSRGPVSRGFSSTQYP